MGARNARAVQGDSQVSSYQQQQQQPPQSQQMPHMQMQMPAFGNFFDFNPGMPAAMFHGPPPPPPNMMPAPPQLQYRPMPQAQVGFHHMPQQLAPAIQSQMGYLGQPSSERRLYASNNNLHHMQSVPKFNQNGSIIKF